MKRNERMVGGSDSGGDSTAVSGNETGLKSRLDEIWGTENTATEALEAATNAEPDAASQGDQKPAAGDSEGAAPGVANGTDGADSIVAPPADIVGRSSEDNADAGDVSAGGSDAGDEEVPPEDIAGDSKKLNAWTKIRAEKKELKLENARLKQELDAAKQLAQSGAEAGRIAELEKQLGQYEERIGQYDVTQTQAFAEKFTNPLIQRYKRLVALLSKGSDEATADKKARELLVPASDRDALLADHPITVQAAAGALLAEMDGLQESRDEAIKNWRETKAVLSEQETRQGLTNLHKTVVEDTNKAVEALRMEGNYLYQLSQSDDGWNKQVQARIAALQGVLKTGEREDMVKLVADGLTARIYREWYEREHKRAEKLASQINSRIRSAPELGGSARAAEVVSSKPGKPRPMGSVLDSIWGADTV
jgi:hypothetical protein